MSRTADVIFECDEKPGLRRLMPVLWIVLIAAVVMAVSMVRKSRSAIAMPAVHSTLLGNAAGHEIKADIDAPGYLVDRPDGAGIEFLQHVLVIEQDRLLLDGKEKARILATARIRVVVSDTKLSVMADGKNALRTTIRR